MARAPGLLPASYAGMQPHPRRAGGKRFRRTMTAPLSFGSIGPMKKTASDARYGIDGGVVVIPLYACVLGGLTAAALRARRGRRPGLAWLAGLAVAAVAASEASYLYSTGPGKHSVWSELLDGLDLDGDEQILDVGCGRGAVLIQAARRLTGGRAVGADVWHRRDQSGNSRSSAEHNAVCEGVADRVELVNADARELPFPSGSFDVVVSNLVFHNILHRDQRARAVREAARVLRPGGRLRIVDFGGDSYAGILRAAGCGDVTTARLDWRTSFGVPGYHLTLVAAAKPSAAR